MRPVWILRRLAFLCVVLSIIVFGGGIGWALGNNPILSFMLLGSFVIHVATRPAPRELLATLAVAAVYRAAYAAAADFRPYFGSALISWGGFLGLASLTVLLFQIQRSRGELREVLRATFVTAGALPYSWIFLAFCLGFVAHTPHSYDAYLLAFDRSLGQSLSFLFGRVLAANPLLHNLTRIVYDALPLGACCILAWNNISRVRPVRVIPMYISMMICGYGLYWLYPAAGPAFAFRAYFPHATLAKWEIIAMPLESFTAPRNAMPSLHFGAMLLLMWNSRAWPLSGRAAAALFSCGIAFATLALGEHYLIDLVVAFPFMLALQACWSHNVPFRSAARYQPLMAGIAATAAWLTALRFAIPAFLASPALAWACVLLTIAGTIWMERRLARLVWGFAQRDTAAVLAKAAMARAVHAN